MRQFIFCFFYPTFFLFFASLFIRGPYQFENIATRQVAQVLEKDCGRIFEMILDMDRVSTMKRGKFAALLRTLGRKWKGRWDKYPIDFEQYMFYRREFAAILENSEHDAVPPEMLQTRPEAILAYMQEINRKYYLNIDEKVKELNKKQRRHVHAIFNQIGSEYKWTLKSQMNLIADLLGNTIGPDAKLISKEIFNDDKAERRVLRRILMLETTYLGLKESFRRSGIFPMDEGYIKMFFNSSVGQVIISAALFSPRLFGSNDFLVYLPRLGHLRVPEKIMREMFEDGVTNEKLQKLEEMLTEIYQLNYFTSLSNRARLERWSRWVQKIITPTMIVGLIAWDVFTYYEDKAVKNEEPDYLGDKLAKVANLYQRAKQLDDIGIDILHSWKKVKLSSREYSEDQERKEKLREVMSNHVCRDLKDCYMTMQIDLGIADFDRSNNEHVQAMQMCVDLFDNSIPRMCPDL